MRIHRIALEDVRGLHRVEVRFAADGPTVVEAPNESGKTTLFDALDVLLHERDRAGKKHVKALQPVDRDVPTTIEAELSLGPHRLTVRKRFNKQPATELMIATPSRRQLTGDEAHDELQRLLEEHTDLALLEALRFRQGRSLDPVALGTSTSLAGLLDAGAGGAGTGDEDALYERVLEEAARYHTLKARAATKLLTEADEAVAQAEAEEARLHRLEAELTEAADRAAAVAVEQRDLRRRREELGPELTGRREAARTVAGLRTARQTAQAAVQVAEATRDRSRAGHATRRALAAEVARAEAAVITAEERRRAAEAQLAPERAALADEEARLARLDAEAQRRTAALTTARLRADLEQATRELQRARVRRERIDAAHEAARAAASALAGTRSTPDRHQRVRAAADALRLAEARLGAEAPTLTVLARQDLLVASDDLPEGAATVRLAAGERRELQVPDRVRLRLGDLADVEVAAGRSLEERQVAVRTATEQLRAACDDLGVEDRAAAEALAESVARHRVTLAERDAAVARELDGDDLDALEATLRDRAATEAALRNRLEERAADGPTMPPAQEELGPDPAALERQETQLTALRDDLAAARVQRDTRAQAVAAGRDELVTAEAAAGAVAAERDRVVAALGRARAEVADEALADEVTRAEAAEAAAQEALAAVDAQLTAVDADVVELAVEVAEAELDALDRRLAQLREEAAGLAARIEVRGGDGVGEARQAAEAERHRRRRDRDALRRRAAAAVALRDALELARDEAYAAYRAPLRERIVAAGRLVLGEDLDVELDEELRVTTRTLAGISLPFEQLSAGAREQLAILTALAAADLAGDGGVPVILDDTLGYTDPVRLERLAALLGRTRGPQVVVLTCVGSRFAGIPGAQVVHLRDDPGAARA